jgi:hypothetical protein
VDLLSRLDLFDIGRTYIEGRALNLGAGIVDVEGSDANLFVGSTSFMGAALSNQLADRIAALLLASARGEDLDRYAWDRHQMTRKGASPAVGGVRFFRKTAAAGAGSIAIGTLLNTLVGPQYVTTSTATFGATQLDGPVANVRAVKAGKDFQVGRNQIRLIPSASPPLFDLSLQVTNDNPTSGGEPRESDAAFKVRIRAAKQASARGTLPAIEFGAKAVPGIASAQAVEALSPISGLPARVVQLYIADSSGIASDALGAIVDEALFDWRAGGIAVLTATSQPTMVSIVLHLAFLANTQGTNAIVEQIRAAVVGFVNSLPVNAGLYVGDLYSLVRRYAQVGLIPQQSSIVSPGGDLIPTAGQTIRTTIDRVTVV